MANTFFSSDHHFGHKGVITYQDRPFDNVHEMNEALIKKWNDKVGKNDVVYYLGDMALCSRKWMADIVFQLNGTIHYILGNHENYTEDFYPDRFKTLTYYMETYIDKQKICMFHYPMMTWNKSHHESWGLHGHCHFNLKEDPNARRMDVGVDNPRCGFAPFSFEEIRAYMNTIEFKPVDHHGRSRV